MSRRVLAALGVHLAWLLLLVAPPPASAQRAEPDWANLPYFGYDNTGYYFDVASNGELWKAYRVINVPSGYTPPYLTPEFYSGKQVEAIWAKTCPATKGQKVTLSRQVQLAGEPGQLLLNVQRTVLDLATRHQGKVPISSVEVRLNGFRIAKLTGKKDGVNAWKSIDVSAHRDAVTYGANTVTVVATKAKTTKAQGFCASGTPDFGVAVELVGRPVSDLVTTVAPFTAYSIGFQAVATVTNHGPSYAANASFNLQTGQETATDVTDLSLSSEHGTCQAYPSGAGYSGTCALGGLPPAGRPT